jgi:16S rRNA (guanine966-N2)-methyltransferase
MRIIAGEHRGRRLLPPPGDATRPITDRAKQSLFDVLAPRIDDAVVYDCFAGTGSMGLESLSRGARHAWFFERDRGALDRLKQNIDALRVAGRSRVVAGNLFRWFADTPAVADADRPAIVFLDPPYRFLREHPDALRQLAGHLVDRHLAAGGVVVFRHDLADELELPPLRLSERREYGSMAIDLLDVATPAVG